MHKTLLRLVSAFSLLAISGPALAQQFVEVQKDTEGASYDIDNLSIRIEGGLVYSWERIRLAKDKPVPNVAFRHWHTNIVRRVDDCQARRTQILSTVLYDANGKIVGGSQKPDPFIDVAPNSVGFGLLEAVCGRVEQIKSLRHEVNFGPDSKIDWLQFAVAPGTPPIAYYYDPNSIENASDSIRQVNLKAVGPGATDYSVELYDCVKNAFGVAESDQYSATGLFINSMRAERTPSLLKDAGPGSIARTLGQRLCAAQTPAEHPSHGEISSGTGWLGPKGYILTAAHVVKGASQIGLAQEGKIVGSAEIVAIDDSNDVAVLKPKLSIGAPPTLQVRHAPARIGEGVFTLGYPSPSDLGLNLKMTSGEVSATAGPSQARPYGSDPRMLQISVPIQPGNSGGPLLDDEGAVVGIVVARQLVLADGTPAQNVNFAMKESYLEPLLTDLSDLGGQTVRHTSENKADLVAATRGSIFLVVVRAE
jgi:S1-C subfamily serine protease